MKTKIVITLPVGIAYSRAKGILAKVEKEYGAGNDMHSPGCEVEMVNEVEKTDQPEPCDCEVYQLCSKCKT
jgi:hypothetical protein